ncbi:MAG: hypothetical protein HC869_04480 [Rhodospirillales bacterium]|nr:hypothetical protein [Rhodospirillales bacterium]
MTPIAVTLVIIVVGFMGLAVWRQMDRLHDARVSAELLLLAGPPVQRFEGLLVADLPEPAQRYFKYTIAEGAPLSTAVEIEMNGEIGLGTKQRPDYRLFRAQQILAPPHGFVWRLGAGVLSGSDGATSQTSWTRFWLFGVIPIVRMSGQDHHRSAFGRLVAEGAFWSPASLLPSETVRWEPIDKHTAQAVVTHGSHVQNVEITVNEQGQPVRVVIQRWSNANAEKVFREQPFGGFLTDFRDVEGYKLPFRVEGGNLIGTDAYFPFFKATIERMRLGKVA